jgi:uncharacterized membrane protein
MAGLTFAVTLVCALGAGLIAGVFFGFSSFIMTALGQQPPAHGIAAMQAINVVVLNPVFLGVFVGTAALCGLLIVVALLASSGPAALARIGGGLLYVVGTFGVTLRFNVPLNNALARVEPASAEGASLWADYLVRWTTWNHVRTAAGLLAAAALTLSLC